MTQIREKTLEMLERMPEDKIVYVFNILQNIEALSAGGEKPEAMSEDDAFATIMRYSRSLPEDFDYKEELNAGNA